MATLILTPQQISVSLESKDGELRLDSRIMADGFGISNHKSYRTNVLMKYELVFAELGDVVKTTLSTGEIVWYLNQAQVRFAITKARRGLTKKGIEYLCSVGWLWAKAYEGKRTRSKVSEKDYSDALAQFLNGKREVCTIAGNVDILTSSEIIEVKAVKQWKAAIGQVLIYGSYYPSHQKRIHLYGETQEAFLSMISVHCDRLDIKMTWES